MNRGISAKQDDAKRPALGQPLRVLVVEDSQDDAALLIHLLSRAEYDLTYLRVDSAPAMRAALTRPWDIIISDYSMPQFSGLAALQLVQEAELDLPFILVSGSIGEDVAVGAMKAGAHDYLMKNNLTRLVPAVQRELREVGVRRERKRATAALRDEAQIAAALARVGRELISSLDTPVLLDRLCQLIVEILGCDTSHAFVWQPDESVYVPVSSCGDTREHWEALRVLKIPTEQVTALASALQLDEVTQVQAADVLEEAPRAFAMRTGATLLFIALRRGADLAGLLIASYRAPGRGFTPQQERIARGIGQLASMALENARLVEELARANRVKGDFVATMSHELRTPLNVIIGYQDLLLDGAFGSLLREQLEIVERANRSARELLQLITATLDLSRLDAGQLPIEQKEIAPQDLLEEIAAETRVTRIKPGLHVQWNVASQLPRLRTDPLKLKVVLKNVIANAVKFTEHGSVTVEAHQRNDGIEVTVVDTGIGITPEVLPIIFEPFRQGDSSSTRQYGGVGLGLYITRRLLDVLGGTISVDSQPGHGSTFRVWVPTQREGGGSVNANGRVGTMSA